MARVPIVYTAKAFILILGAFTMQTKTEQLNLRLTTDEKKALLQKAEERNFKNLSEFILCSIIRPQRLNTKSTLKFLNELNRMGHNANQIARKCNQNNSVDVDVLQALELIQEEMNNLIEAIKNVD